MMHNKDGLVPELKATNEHFELNLKYIQRLLARVLNQPRIKQILAQVEKKELPTEYSAIKATKIYLRRFMTFAVIAGIIAMVTYLIAILGH